MSIKIMNLVWEGAPYRGNTLLTLLALADWSNDEGYSFPALATLAKKSRQSVRSVQHAIGQLSGDQMLVANLNQGRGSRNEFWVNTKKLRVLVNEQNTAIKPAVRDVQTCKTQRRNKEEPSGTVIEPKSSPPYPPKGGLSSRDLQRLSKEMQRIFSVNVGVYPPISDGRALEVACSRLFLPLDQAREALKASEV